ncbi:hypothetical protein [Cryobacterium psychrophilum]|uniref:Uncharacterized protein n=1 Tax=Cryobacterium psychrophilum TaxID=41988 RepID=A0A4Y8KNQ9_9MICO|nr:hypothetical protein [Cryobacterium psychrophilum]TDW30671.1 hypothetical protein EDD25_2440 [Cryobacterium psychrophilum]TFD77088.1 hypothetical protein E3T53_12545 [Cryobacterium psychrophilum]
MTHTQSANGMSSREPAQTAPPASEFDPSEIVFITQGVTAAEASAVIALLRGLLREESDERRTAPGHGQSAWQMDQRSIRTPITPGPGRWRSFSG